MNEIEAEEEEEEEEEEEVNQKTILHWNYRGFKNLPIVIKNHGIHVREIYLKSNNLKSLPPWIRVLENLRNLYLCDNLIEELPAELECLKLTVLDLKSNKLYSIPSSLSDLKTLKYLNLDDNLIDRIPDGCRQLENLEYLSISGNRLTFLPGWIGFLPELKDLIADNNFLEELPNSLTLAPQLINLSVCSNRLKYLPLNAFVSSPSIKFDSNEYLNYLSYSLLCQLVSNIQQSFNADLTNVLARGCFQKKSESNYQNRLNNLVRLKFYKSKQSEEILLELPRQLLTIHEIEENAVVTLWESALRKFYFTRYKHTLKIKKSNIELSYERLLDKNNEMEWERNFIPNIMIKNGPLSICGNNSCLKAIFTEAWIISGTGLKICEIPTIILFCSQKCAAEFTKLISIQKMFDTF